MMLVQATKEEIQIKAKIGTKSNGFLYLATNGDGDDVILRTISDTAGMGLFRNLHCLIASKMPHTSLLWPQIVEKDGMECGYIVNKIPCTFHNLLDFWCARTQFSSFSTRLQAALFITNAIRNLHIHGFCFLSLDGSNIYVEPNSGEVLIDIENITIINSRESFLGTYRYLAPEIDDGGNVNVNSDLYSLAILLYRLFMLDHPFEGESIIRIPCLTACIERRKYGREAVFVYDSVNDSNRPNPHIHKNSRLLWRYTPFSLKQMFQRSLSHDAITNPAARVSAIEWKNLFLQLRRTLIVCPNSSKDKDHDFLADGIVNVCPRCNDRIMVNTVLHFSDNTDFIVTPHKFVYIGDEMNPIARGVTKVNDNGIKELGIQNLSDVTWNITTSSGQLIQIFPSNAMPLINNIQIRFRSDCACRVNVIYDHLT